MVIYNKKYEIKCKLGKIFVFFGMLICGFVLATLPVDLPLWLRILLGVFGFAILITGWIVYPFTNPYIPSSNQYENESIFDTKEVIKDESSTSSIEVEHIDK